MVDDKYKSSDDADEEFEFGEIEHKRDEDNNDFKEEEFVIPSRNQDLNMSGAGESNLFRNLIIGGVTVVLLFAAYKLFKVYSSEKVLPVAIVEKTNTPEKKANFDEFLKSKASPETKPAEPSLFEVKKSTAMEPMPIDLKEKSAVTPIKIEPNKVETPPVEPVKPEIVKPAVMKTEVVKPEVTNSAVTKTEPVRPSVENKKIPHPMKEVAPENNSVKQMESEVSKLNRTLERLDQRITQLDEKIREEKMHHDKNMHESLINKVLAEPRHKRPAPVTPSPVHHQRAVSQPSQPVQKKEMPQQECYSVESLSRHSAIIIRLDNQTEMNVSRGDRLPYLIQQEGRCIAKPGETVEITTLDGETGSLRIGGGLSLITPTKLAVEAVISGRAWLKDSNGSTITVEEGTIIPGYGRVTEIDVSEGIVRTSSGRMIQHRIDER